MSKWRETIELLPVEKVILPQNNPKKPYYNPSICWYKDKLVIAIRSSTWSRGEHGTKPLLLGKLHTDIVLGELDPTTLKASKLRKLEYAGDVHPFIQNIGLEDARIYVRDGQLHAIGVCMSKDDRRGESVHIAHGIIKGDKIVFKSLLTKPHPERIEKNWTPPEIATDKFDYIYSATQTIKDGKLSDGVEYHGRIHGGSQAIKWEGGYLSFVHKIHRMHHDWDGFHQYVSYALKYDANGIATDISQGFILFGDNQVEFISGLVLGKDGKLLVSLGLGDCHAVLAKIDYKDLRFEEYNWREEPIRAYLSSQATDQT